MRGSACNVPARSARGSIPPTGGTDLQDPCQGCYVPALWQLAMCPHGPGLFNDRVHQLRAVLELVQAPAVR